MSTGQPYLPRSGTSERLLVEEMIRDTNSEHWGACHTFVQRCVYSKARNIPPTLQEDIIQEVMYKVTKYLPHFRFQCAVKTWVNQIIESCIIDVYRRVQNEGPHQALIVDPPNESEREGEELNTGEVRSAEDAFEASEEIRNGIKALLEYANSHSNPIRDRLILRMVLFEGYTHEAAARAAGCHAPVVGYVVREAQRYAREMMGHKL